MFTRPTTREELLCLLQEHSNKQAEPTATSNLDTSILTLLLNSSQSSGLTDAQRTAVPSLLPSLRDHHRPLPDSLSLAVQQDYQQLQHNFLQEMQQQQARLAQQPSHPASQQLVQSDLFYRLIASDFANGLQHQQDHLLLDTYSLQDEKPYFSSTAKSTSTSSCRLKRNDALLHKLGSTLPRRSDLFIDASKLQGPIPTDDTFRRNRGGVSETFPEKLHRMLTELETSGSSSSPSPIAGFLTHGRAFMIHDPDKFASELMPHYFGGQGKWSSFARQLRLYGVLRIHAGPDAGAYYHALFLRGRPDLVSCMRRVGAPMPRGQPSQSSRKTVDDDSEGACCKASSSSKVVASKPRIAAAVSDGGVPNFYAMDRLP